MRRSRTGLVPPSRSAALRASALLLALALLAPPAPAQAAPPAARPSLPADEDYLYDIDFLFFTNVAEANLRLRRLDGLRYRAELTAETKGFIGFLSGYRKNHYTSEMEYDPARGRLATRRYTKMVQRGRNLSKTVMEIDPQARTVRWRTSFNDEPLEGGVEPIPGGVAYEDLLSAFFNFRGGGFGPPAKGRHFTVLTLPAYDTPKEEKAKGENLARDFDIRIADPETEKGYREAYGREQEKGLLTLVKVPKELFGQETGEVRVWFDENLIPVSATVDRAYFIGDVRATLRQAAGGPPPRALRGANGR